MEEKDWKRKSRADFAQEYNDSTLSFGRTGRKLNCGQMSIGLVKFLSVACVCVCVCVCTIYVPNNGCYVTSTGKYPLTQ